MGFLLLYNTRISYLYLFLPNIRYNLISRIIIFSMNHNNMKIKFFRRIQKINVV